MATFKIPYNGTNYSLYLTKEKITTPSLTISGEGYAPLYSEKKIGDPILEGTNILTDAIGSNLIGSALKYASLNAITAAILNALSLESTG